VSQDTFDRHLNRQALPRGPQGPAAARAGTAEEQAYDALFAEITMLGLAEAALASLEHAALVISDTALSDRAGALRRRLEVIKAEARHTKNGRGACSGCRRDMVALNDDGTVRAHRNGSGRCAGSNRKPRGSA
jgi:hypothetical protein